MTDFVTAEVLRSVAAEAKGFKGWIQDCTFIRIAYYSGRTMRDLYADCNRYC